MEKNDAHSILDISRAEKGEVTMAQKKRNRLWEVGLAVLILTGCSNEAPEITDVEIISSADAKDSFGERDTADAEGIAAILSDIFEEAAGTNTLGSLDTMGRMVARLGENGYVAVDSGNQVDMTRPEQVLEFCEAVDEEADAAMSIIVITQLGFRQFDLTTEDGIVDIVRTYYQYDLNGQLQNKSIVSYPADFWQYTEEGYLSFEGSYVLGESYVLTVKDKQEHTMLRVLPLDETCREMNRKYILPVGYEQNNLFLCNWSEEDFGELDFYDLFDRLYPMVYRQPLPYVADENIGVGAVYQIPEGNFENVIGTYLNVGGETLRSKAIYLPEQAAYEYRPRGFYEAEYPDIAYPEVVDYTENADGTITLDINAVYPNGDVSKEFSHTTVIRPLDEGSFQYVSNEIILPEADYDICWHSKRLTVREWEETYGCN